MRLIFALTILAAPAGAHEWYPLSCCSSRDCYEVSRDDIEAREDGYFVKSSGETIPYDQVRETPPEGAGMFHRCSTAGNPEGVTIGLRSRQQACFWAPPMAF